MTFDEILTQVIDLLQRNQRVSSRGLKRRFDIDDEYLEDIKEEIIGAQRVATDEDGRYLVLADTDAVPAVTSSPPPQTGSHSANRPPVNPPKQSLPTGERRQLTVMFCDLVGSTALSEQLDPEELHQMVRAYQQACAEVITHYEGYIAQYLGDGLLIYFGYPAAHEDDAIRSVHSSLEILENLQQLKLAHPLQVRIGIHTGHVVVGEVGGEGKTEQLALGDTPNIAARVQGKAEPNTVIISADTYHLVQGYFACRDLGLQDLKGLSAPLGLYQVEGQGEAQNRFDVSVQKGLTPLVGREEESELLHRRWERVKAGEGQVVLLSGEAGIGKSRLVQVLRDHISEEPQFSAVFRCSPFYQNSALYPIIHRLQRFLRLSREDSAENKLRKLTRALTLSGMADQETVALLAALLSIPLPEDKPPLQLSPQKQKEKTLQTLVVWLQKMSEQQPVLLEVEDLHWADPSTVELLGLFIDQVPSFRILVLLTFRPEFTPPWAMQAYMLPLQLSRLPQTQIEDMILRISGKGMPAEIVQQLLAKSDGVPLYIEEMTKNLLESGLLKETDGQFEATGPLPQLAIPTTLQDSFASRLDRLAPVRELAQIGAVLGREFSYELIRAVAKLDETTLQEGLKQLGAAEILYQRGVPPQATYSFKHALLQDASYESLLKSKRQQLHTQTAQMLEQQFAETVESQPEILAHHYTEASLAEQAIPYWLKAGQRAAQQCAHVEGINHFHAGLTLLKELPETTERYQQELTFNLALGPSIIATKGYAVTEVEQVYTQARELCERLDDAPQLFYALHGVRTFYLIRGKLRTAHRMTEQLFELAKGGQDTVSLHLAHTLMGESLHYQGKLTLARPHFEAGAQLYNSEVQRALQRGALWVDTGVGCFASGGLTLWYLGSADQGLKAIYEASARAEKLSHPFTFSIMSCLVSWMHRQRREAQACYQWAEKAISISIEYGFPSWLILGKNLQGWALSEQGEATRAVSELQQGISDWRQTGALLVAPAYLTWLANAQGKAGNLKQGLASVTEALSIIDQTEMRLYEPEAHWLKGELLLQRSDNSTSEAEASLQKALEVSRHLEFKAIELRAAMSLSRLWQHQGKKTEAHDLLAPVYNWFTEGFDTQDLKDAKSLLDELT